MIKKILLSILLISLCKSTLADNQSYGTIIQIQSKQIRELKSRLLGLENSVEELKLIINKPDFTTHEIFGLAMPNACENVPTEMLNPKNTWEDKSAYDSKANHLANEFVKNFKQFESDANAAIMDAAPKATTNA